MTHLDTEVSEFAQQQLASKTRYQLQKQFSHLANDDIRHQLEEVSSGEEMEDSELYTPTIAKKERQQQQSLSIYHPNNYRKS